MIISISRKGLRLLWEKNNSSKLPSEQIGKMRRLLSVLDTAKAFDPLKAINNNTMECEMPPIHPGAVLREDILKEMKLSVTKAAEGIAVSRKQLSEVVNEVAAISAEMAVRLENGFGVKAEFWPDMQKMYDIWKVKQSGRAGGVRCMNTTSPAA